MGRGKKIDWYPKLKEIEKIIPIFYEEYFRPPTIRELNLLCGINQWPQWTLGYNYEEFLESIGYGGIPGCKTVEVLENDEVIFTGTIYDVMEELNMSKPLLLNYLSRGKPYHKKYKLRYKKFNGKLEGLV